MKPWLVYIGGCETLGGKPYYVSDAPQFAASLISLLKLLSPLFSRRPQIKLHPEIKYNE